MYLCFSIYIFFALGKEIPGVAKCSNPKEHIWFTFYYKIQNVYDVFIHHS